jgi:hypothetical protein
MSLTELTDEELGQLVSLGAGDAVLALKLSGSPDGGRRRCRIRTPGSIGERGRARQRLHDER